MRLIAVFIVFLCNVMIVSSQETIQGEFKVLKIKEQNNSYLITVKKEQKIYIIYSFTSDSECKQTLKKRRKYNLTLERSLVLEGVQKAMSESIIVHSKSKNKRKVNIAKYRLYSCKEISGICYNESSNGRAE